MFTPKAIALGLAVACILATVAAIEKPEIKTIDDNINVEVPMDKDIMFQRAVTRQSNVADVMDRLKQVEAQLDAIPTRDMIASFNAQVDNLRDRLKGVIAGNEESAANALKSILDQKISDAKKKVDDDGESLLLDITKKVGFADDKLEKTESSTLKNTNDQIQQTSDDVDNSLLAMQGKLNQQVGQITQTLDQNTKASNQKLATLGQSINKDLSGAVKEMNDKLKSLEDKVSTVAKAAAEAVEQNAYPKRLVWAGGCRSHGHRDGWMPYCHDATEFNTLDQHVQLTGENENSGFRVKKAGYYRINHWYNGERNWNNMGVWHNNRHIHEGNEYTDGNWHDMFADLTWKMQEGDLFYIQIYGSGHGHWNYHAWNAQGAHSRLEIEYLGALPL